MTNTKIARLQTRLNDLRAALKTARAKKRGSMTVWTILTEIDYVEDMLAKCKPEAQNVVHTCDDELVTVMFEGNPRMYDYLCRKGSLSIGDAAIAPPSWFCSAYTAVRVVGRKDLSRASKRIRYKRISVSRQESDATVARFGLLELDP